MFFQMKVGTYTIPMVALARREVGWGPGALLGSWITDEVPLVLPQELRELREILIREKLDRGITVTNGPTLELIDFLAADRLVLQLRIGCYYNSLLHQALDRELPDGSSVRQRYGFFSLQDFRRSPLPRMVGCTSVLVTADGSVLLTRRSSQVGISEGQNHLLGQGMRPVDGADPFATAQRCLLEELGLGPGSLRQELITGLGVSAQFLQPDIALFLRSDLRSGEFSTLPPGLDAWENEHFRFVPWDPAVVAGELRQGVWSPHAQFSLVMALLHCFGQTEVERAFS